MGKLSDEKQHLHGLTKTYRTSDEGIEGAHGKIGEKEAPPGYEPSTPTASSSSSGSGSRSRWRPRALIKSLIPRKVQISSSAETHSHTLPPSYASLSTLPDPIIARIAEHLSSTYSLPTLSALSRTSKQTYLAVQPILYRRLRLSTRSSMDCVLSIAPLTTTEYGRMAPSTQWLKMLDVWKGDAVTRGTYWEKRNEGLRRLVNLRYCETLFVGCIPGTQLLGRMRGLLELLYYGAKGHGYGTLDSESDTEADTNTEQEGDHQQKDGPEKNGIQKSKDEKRILPALLPALRRLCLGRDLVEALMSRQTNFQLNYIRNMIHLSRVRLSHICLTYPTCPPPSDILNSLINPLAPHVLIDSFSDLSSLTIHDAFHHSLPTILGGSNLYAMYTRSGGVTMIPSKEIRVGQLVEALEKTYQYGFLAETTFDIYDAGRDNISTAGREYDGEAWARVNTKLLGVDEDIWNELEGTFRKRKASGVELEVRRLLEKKLGEGGWPGIGDVEDSDEDEAEDGDEDEDGNIDGDINGHREEEDGGDGEGKGKGKGVADELWRRVRFHETTHGFLCAACGLTL